MGCDSFGSGMRMAVAMRMSVAVFYRNDASVREAEKGAFRLTVEQEQANNIAQKTKAPDNHHQLRVADLYAIENDL